MQVLLNSEARIKDHRGMTTYLETLVAEKLGHHGERITRVDAHLSDDNSAAKADIDDIHCTLAAHLSGLEPVVVKDRAASPGQAIHGAVAKLERAVSHAVGKHEPRRAKDDIDDSSIA